jgi:hypothetical protein
MMFYDFMWGKLKENCAACKVTVTLKVIVTSISFELKRAASFLEVH